MPGFPRLLAAVADAYDEHARGRREPGAADLPSHLAPAGSCGPTARPAHAAICSTPPLDGMLAAHDNDKGGFGRAPKFPQRHGPRLPPAQLPPHRRRPTRSRRPSSTLDAMAQGGMYDQVGGGFHRYSTDDVWLVPHFEKMLYDNALLARVYLDACKLTGTDFYRRIARGDAGLRPARDDRRRRRLLLTQDADSEGEEGQVLPLDAGRAARGPRRRRRASSARFFGVTDGGNFEGTQHPQRARRRRSVRRSARPRRRRLRATCSRPRSTSSIEARETARPPRPRRQGARPPGTA